MDDGKSRLSPGASLALEPSLCLVVPYYSPVMANYLTPVIAVQCMQITMLYIR